MIQFNLLPDVKQQYIHAKRMKRTAIVISFLIAASSLFIFVMLFLSVHVFQQKHIKNINEDIATTTKKLKNIKDLDKILTIQNQLNSLPALHVQKPVVSRLAGYLSQTTPLKITIGELEVDYDQKTMKIIGTSDSLENVNKFVDTLKFSKSAEIPADGTAAKENVTKPFSSVVLNAFTRKDQEATYEIIANFDPAIFDNSKNIKLIVPKITTTRSETEKPTQLFKALPKDNKE